MVYKIKIEKSEDLRYLRSDWFGVKPYRFPCLVFLIKDKMDWCMDMTGENPCRTCNSLCNTISIWNLKELSIQDYIVQLRKKKIQRIRK